MDHFVDHRSTEKRMRMTTNSDCPRLRVQRGIRELDESFDIAGGTDKRRSLRGYDGQRLPS